ncbi:putative PPC domain-containing protein [Medicago truncatula]|uniref:AT-hook motif nuclear-localized protein n=1 Tax=Medicago truncatula TaxID=3880 RepID=A0A396I4M5_MEDTR|nr:putative PPC domain-containing protein [Medicago truncatula]
MLEATSTYALIFVADECIAETDGGNMTPYMLIVNPREDVVRKLFAFMEKVPQENVCILSACGTVSSLTLCEPDVSNGFSRHEGHFDILSLSGPCTITGGAAGGSQRKIGMLSVSLAQPDGKVFGGRVDNLLIAATTVKVRIFF